MGFDFKKFLPAFNPVALIGTGAQVGMDYLAMEEGKKQNSQQMRHEDQVNIANIAHAREMADRNEKLQREFAQMGIRWRVEDAKAAGLHPLAALGASGASASGSSPVQLMSGDRRDNSKMDFLHRTGQNVSRAINATSTTEERAFKALQLESMGLDNALKKKELEGTSSMGFPSGRDPYLTGGYGGRSHGLVEDLPLRRTVQDPINSGKEYGAIPDYQYSRTAGGGYAVVPGADVKQRIEDNFIAETQHQIRNFMATMQGKIRLPNGKRALMNPLTGELVPISRAGEFMFGKNGFRGWKNRIWRGHD